MASLLTLQDVRVTLGGTAIGPVTVRVEPGERIAILGPSGAGKSTLLRCINRLAAPSAGEVIVDGTPYASSRRDLRLLRRSVAMIFQQHNLVKRLTVLKNVLVGRMADLSPLLTTLQLFPEADVKIALHCLEQVHLGHKAHQRADALSGGEQQRVGIARAIVTDPTLLLCDEPTGDLDRKAGDEILDLLQALNREHGKTIVMVTHDPHAAERARRTLHLEKGSLLETEVLA